jgi:hypothetical protein
MGGQLGLIPEEVYDYQLHIAGLWDLNLHMV